MPQSLTQKPVLKLSAGTSTSNCRPSRKDGLLKGGRTSRALPRARSWKPHEESLMNKLKRLDEERRLIIRQLKRRPNTKEVKPLGGEGKRREQSKKLPKPKPIPHGLKNLRLDILQKDLGGESSTDPVSQHEVKGVQTPTTPWTEVKSKKRRAPGVPVRVQPVLDTEQLRAKSPSSSLNSVPRVEAKRSATITKPSIATVVTPKRVTKRVPQVGGPSLVATLRHNAGVERPDDPVLEKPIKAVSLPDRIEVSYARKEMGRDKRSRNTKGPALVFVKGKVLPITTQPSPKFMCVADSSLYWETLRQFKLAPRNTVTMKQMSSYIRRAMNECDLRDFTSEEVYNMEMDILEAAMHVPIREAHMIRGLRNFDDIEMMHDHSDFVTKGDLGRVPVKTCFSCIGGTKQQYLPRKPTT